MPWHDKFHHKPISITMPAALPLFGAAMLLGAMMIAAPPARGQLGSPPAGQVHESECLVEIDGGAAGSIPANACSQPVNIAYCIAAEGDNMRCQNVAAFQSLTLAGKTRSKMRVPQGQIFYAGACLAPRTAVANLNGNNRVVLLCSGDGPTFAASGAIGPAPRTAVPVPAKSSPAAKPATVETATAGAAPPAPRPSVAVAPPASAPISSLNAEQAAAAAARLKAEQDKAAEYQRRLAEVEAENKRRLAEYEKAQAEYQAQLAAQKAEAERIARANAEAQARYQQALADAEACRKGDKSRCK